MYLACNLGKICSLSLSIHLRLRITVFLARFLIRRFAATAASRDAWTLVLLHTKELVCLPRSSLSGSQQSSRGNNCCTARSKHEVPTRNFAAWMTPSPWQDCDNATCTLRVEAVLRLYLPPILVSLASKKWIHWVFILWDLGNIMNTKLHPSLCQAAKLSTAKCIIVSKWWIHDALCHFLDWFQFSWQEFQDVLQYLYTIF